MFLEDRVENGTDGPTRLVKLKKRQLNEPPFDSKTGRSYMEKFLETDFPGHEMVHEICVSPPSLKLTSNNGHEPGLEILEISTVRSQGLKYLKSVQSVLLRSHCRGRIHLLMDRKRSKDLSWMRWLKKPLMEQF